MTELWDLPAESYVTTRNHLHQIAFFAVSPARYRAVQRMGLTATPRGFGTPEFDGKVARVEGRQLIYEADGNVAMQRITTIRGAAEFFAGEYAPVWFDEFHDPLSAMDPDTALDVDETSSCLIGDWFRFGFAVLNQLRERGDESDDVSEAQLWPEHFDAATELGSQDLGRRASYGASPGDGGIPEPYFYVAPWSEIDRSDSYWNAEHFGGSVLKYAKLASSDDPEATAFEFLWKGYQKLRA